MYTSTSAPAKSGPSALATNAARQPYEGVMKPAIASESAVPMPKNEV